jgi:hypothetical protein
MSTLVYIQRMQKENASEHIVEELHTSTQDLGCSSSNNIVSQFDKDEDKKVSKHHQRKSRWKWIDKLHNRKHR